MILHSTNGVSPKVSFSEAIANGIAPDGGLYMPDSLPKLPQALFRNIQEMSLREVGFVVMSTLFADTIPSAKLKAIVDDALDFEVPLKRLDDTRFVLELFHGPTNTFKDFGARFMARLLPVLAPTGEGKQRNIIMATSGDSGGAVANAFSRSAGTSVIILFPKGGLTQAELMRFATLRHVHAIEVDGTFDQCQAMVKEALRNDAVKGEQRLTAGNSINPARELPSVIYFFYAYAKAVEATERRDGIVISVPCGNLGSLAAALMAKRMGLPVAKFIAANNANDTFVEYLKTGGFRPRTALLTLARAMDVGNPSNIARIIDLYGGNPELLRADVEGYAYSDDEIAATMSDAYRKFGVHVDPQGATALRAIERHLKPGETGIAIASGHAGNYPSAVSAATGVAPRVPRAHQCAPQAPRILRIPATQGALTRLLSRF